jgi:membrane protein implicated in regulation of membrane protease activity
MEDHLTWAIFGLALIIVELLTGTFYLLVLGFAAFGAAVAAWAGADFPVQAIVAGAIAAIGCYGVHMYRAKNSTRQMPSVDSGNPAKFESWIDQNARLARVSYRGAPWNARVEGGDSPEPGAIIYVQGTDGNTLKVSTRRAG